MIHEGYEAARQRVVELLDEKIEAAKEIESLRQRLAEYRDQITEIPQLMRRLAECEREKVALIRAIDEEMVVTHLGVFNLGDDPKVALNKLMHWSQCVGEDISECHAKEQLATVIAERDELVATMEHLLEYWNGDNNETAMHDALTHFDDVIRAALTKLGADETGEGL